MTEPVDPIAIALTVTRALDALGIIHTIGGSIASSIAGEPRSTLDIDIVAALHESHVAPLVEALSTEFYVDDEALRRAVRQHSSANVIHQATQLKVDIFVAGGTPLDEQQLRRRQAVEIGDGKILHVHPPEDILLQKLRWYRRGGVGSERQWRDILGIIRVQGPDLDRDYLQANAPALDVTDLLDRALGEANTEAVLPMERYRHLSGDSGVTDYELGQDFIRIRFQGGLTYRYGHVRPGQHHVDRMKALAIAGQGLGTYISQHVRDQYEKE